MRRWLAPWPGPPSPPRGASAPGSAPPPRARCRGKTRLGECARPVGRVSSLARGISRRRTEVATQVEAAPTGLRPNAVVGVRLAALADQVGAALAEGPAQRAVTEDRTVTGVTLRAQDVSPGDLFAALTGSTTHGARHVGDAIARGASRCSPTPPGSPRSPDERPCPCWCTPHPAACSAAWPPPCTGIRPSG
ncbi:hypothetical protein B7493_20705 [Mycobacterium tuberculosis variant bovis]|nr:hypothetical protein B7493_20705 [Mycobacterium tuberculosis variant bovis]